MKRKFKVAVYEHITEGFDCEVEVEVPDGVSDADLEDILADEIERERVEGDHERQFCSVDDVDWDEEEIK